MIDMLLNTVMRGQQGVRQMFYIDKVTNEVDHKEN